MNFEFLIYECVCVCVCVREGKRERDAQWQVVNTVILLPYIYYTHTHTYRGTAHIKLQCRRRLNKYKRITNTLSVQYEGDKT